MNVGIRLWGTRGDMGGHIYGSYSKKRTVPYTVQCIGPTII
jgi:hypothetical protein